MNQPVALLLHASAASPRQWDALAALLAPRFAVHAIALHGHGERAPWRDAAPMSLGDEAALVEPLLDAAPGRVHLVGHSYGGAVACEIARRHRHAVASVTVYEPVLFGLLLDDAGSPAEAQQATSLAATVRALVARGRPDAAAAHFIDFWCGAGGWAATPEHRRAATAARMPCVVRHFEAAFAAADPRPALARLPLLALTGAASPAVTRRIGRLLQDSLPRAEHARLARAGHLAPITDPALVNPLIADFLLRITSNETLTA